jgi:dihydroorotate dehydrogenase electron transfer subunit
MKHLEIAKVLENIKLAPDHYRIRLISPKIAKEALPGQFLMVKCSNSFDPLLRRPISFNYIDRTKGTIDILFHVVGKGTRLLSEIEAGEDLNMIGPLGNGFKIRSDKDVAVIIGGGAGIAPLLALAYELKRKVKAVFALLGSKNINHVVLEEDFKQAGCETIVATDDGTYGRKGLITDVLTEILGSNIASMHASIYGCGPKPMLKALQSIAFEEKVPCQVSLEEWMACGFSACNGCTVNTKSGYKKVCSDGPVFNIEELIWQK